MSILPSKCPHQIIKSQWNIPTAGEKSVISPPLLFSHTTPLLSSPLHSSQPLMALQATLLLPPPSSSPYHPTSVSVALPVTGRGVRGRVGFGRAVVRAGEESGAVTVGKITEVDKDTFWPTVEAAKPKIVVLDMYTQWCGPCKVIAPKYEELSQKYLDVVFLKLDCNNDNRPLAKELSIRVVPTFKILKDGEVVKEIKGAKIDELVLAIDAVLAS